VQYPVPEHANKLAYSLGGLTLITFLIMVGSGIFLTQYYDPDPTRAHASVVHITTRVTLGRFVRGSHYWGAMAISPSRRASGPALTALLAARHGARAQSRPRAHTHPRPDRALHPEDHDRTGANSP
jgi:hypothetical protein